MANPSNKDLNIPQDQTPKSAASDEHSRVESSPDTSSDPAFVGLCRAMVGLSVLLLVGLATLVVFTLRSDIDWDASVVQAEADSSLRSASRNTERAVVASEATSEVIRFDTGRLNSDGLMGPADGLRALSYEFCIPADEQLTELVTSIDGTVDIQRRSRGRIGCGAAEYLAIGHTHQPDFEAVLVDLSRLPFVDRIEESHFE